MLKKAIKAGGLVLILTASVGSFLFMNSSSIKLLVSDAQGFEQSELMPDESTIAVPAITIANKAITLVKSFLYPTE